MSHKQTQQPDPSLTVQASHTHFGQICELQRLLEHSWPQPKSWREAIALCNTAKQSSTCLQTESASTGKRIVDNTGPGLCLGLCLGVQEQPQAEQLHQNSRESCQGRWRSAVSATIRSRLVQDLQADLTSLKALVQESMLPYTGFSRVSSSCGLTAQTKQICWFAFVLIQASTQQQH